MKKFLPLLLLTASLAPLALAKPAKDKPAKKAPAPVVNWQPSYWAAFQAAKKTGKPLFIDFYTDWCGPCKYLDQTTYRDPKFIAYSRGWIMVKVNPEKSDFGRQLFEKYQLSGYPSMVFTDGRGKKLGQAVGSYPAEMLLTEMKKAAPKANATAA